MKNFKEKADLIWKVADLLRGDYKQSDYGKVILPFTVLRRLDCVLSKTKDEVLNKLPAVSKLGEGAKDKVLNNIAGFNFHNRSQYNFEKLCDDAENIAKNLRNYINGFSITAREILEYFNFEEQIDRLDDRRTDLLFKVVEEFKDIDLSDMTSMEMGYCFEHLIRKFSEQSNETAGEHFTPREVIRLMVNLIFNEDRDILSKDGIVKTMYDPACGTGGMLSEAETYLNDLNPKAKLEVFGQEINPESYAICKSDMLIKGQNPSNIKFGNTFTIDGLKEERFDYMLSNPPFGVDWKKASKIIKAESENQGFAGRFGAGTPRINDGSLLFLQHMMSKLKSAGSRIGIVFNGSPLFSGAAGSGESNIRQWLIQNDYLEAIVALPDQLFYNTGISTYVWILTNDKKSARRGTVQLIDATGTYEEELLAEGKIDVNRFWEKQTPSLGSKRKKIAENGTSKGIGFITQLYGNYDAFAEADTTETGNEFVRILPNEYFGYWRVQVLRPKMEDGKIIKKNGKKVVDKDWKDYENIPFLYEEKDGSLRKQTIEEYMDREVRPHVPGAWIDKKKTKIGYEINFNRYFYKFKPLRDLSTIRDEILALEEATIEEEKTVLE